jgi:predicted MFS family arabinose efflux permease
MATVVGPAAAGLTYAIIGPAWCFTLNGISYLAVIAALLLMKIQIEPTIRAARSSVEELKEGLRYVLGHSIIRTLVLVATVISLFGLAYATLLPAWAVNILGGDAATNGYLQSARGVGALIGALMIASLSNFRHKGALLMVGMLVFPAALIVFGLIRTTLLSLLVTVVVGWGFMVLFNMLNTTIQSLVEDNLRGRVMSIYSLTFFGGMPIGALWAGAVAQQFGEPLTVILGAAISLAFALLIYWRVPKIRAIA